MSTAPKAEHVGILDRGHGLLTVHENLDGQEVRYLQTLQRRYGNDHVASIVALLNEKPPRKGTLNVQLLQGGSACPAPAQPPIVKGPDDDPEFLKVKSNVEGGAADLKRHPPAKAKVVEVHAAAVPPANDTQTRAQAEQADTMGKAKPGTFDEAGFVAAVNKAIADSSPRTLEEADDFADSGKAGAVKDQVMGKVTKGKEDSAKDVKGKTDAPPDVGKVTPKPVTPMPAEKPGPAPADPKAAAGMPGPAPPEQTTLDAGKCETESAMAEAGVTEEHLRNSNEPQLQEALEAKKAGEEHSATAPDKLREQETVHIEAARGSASESATAALGAMHQKKASTAGHIGGDKGSAKAKEEAKRAEVAGHIQAIYAKTKGDVDGILTGLDLKVGDAFTRGEAEARTTFETRHRTEMAAWKDDRYSGLTGAYRWVRDKFRGLPEEADRIYARARDHYLDRMKQVISGIAHLVGTELTRAKDRIDAGRREIHTYVSGLPVALKKFGAQAQQEIDSKFGDLEDQVDAKKDELVDDLAQRYVEARNAVDDEIRQMQEANQGLWDKAKNAVKGAIELVSALTDMFLNVLSKAASALPDILAHPVRFVENFFGALGDGFSNFASNFLDKWLMKGLLGWLFGQMDAAGIEPPESFTFTGILKFLASLMGLTWSAIRARVVAQAPWAGRHIGFIESNVGVFAALASGGVAGIWEMIKDKVGDLGPLILDPIKEYVYDRIIKAGITWVLGMLNPAGALIKIVQGLVSVVQWLVENASGLAEFLNRVMDVVLNVAAGTVSGMAEKIEEGLGSAVRLVISFLASLLGLGGIGEKVRSVIAAAKKPVAKAVDLVIKGALKAAKPLVAGAERLARGAKGLVAKVKGRLAGVRNRIRGGDDSPEGKRERLAAAMSTALRASDRLRGNRVGQSLLRPMLAIVRRKYGLTALRAVPSGALWSFEGEINPRLFQITNVLVLDNPRAAAELFGRLATKVEREFFSTGLEERGQALVVRGALEQGSAGSVARRGTPAMGTLPAEPAALAGVSSAQFMSARRGAAAAFREAHGRGVPRYVVASTDIGEGQNVAEMLNPTRGQPGNVKLNEVGRYGQAASSADTGDVMGVVNALRDGGMSDAQISRLMEHLSRSGESPSEDLLRRFGFADSVIPQVRTGRSTLSLHHALGAVVHLTHRIESLRFLDRGWAGAVSLNPQPIATTTAMSHVLVQEGANVMVRTRGGIYRPMRSAYSLDGGALDDLLSGNAPLGPATHASLGTFRTGLRGSRPVGETIAISQIRLTELVEQVRRSWSDWVLMTERHLTEEARLRGIADPHLVPTERSMRALLRRFYGHAARGR